jgi:AcrR family transcriptional regulator
MARRADHTHEELYEMALRAAREAAEAEGFKGLTTRKIAGRIGYSTGTLYNLFEGLNDIIVRMNAGTLDRLYDALTEEALADDPEEALKGLARGYIRFTVSNEKLWAVVFDPNLPRRGSLPGWYQEKVRRLLDLVEEAPVEQAARLHSARVLWSGIYGICSLAAAGALASEETLEQMADTLIVYYIDGLRGRETGNA